MLAKQFLTLSEKDNLSQHKNNVLKKLGNNSLKRLTFFKTKTDYNPSTVTVQSRILLQHWGLPHQH